MCGGRSAGNIKFESARDKSMDLSLQLLAAGAVQQQRNGHCWLEIILEYATGVIFVMDRDSFWFRVVIANVYLQLYIHVR